MYSTTVCLTLDGLAVKVSQCWLDGLNSIGHKINLTLNWTRTAAGLLLMPTRIWLIPSRNSKTITLLINKLHQEIKIILRKGNENKGNSFTLTSLFLVILTSNSIWNSCLHYQIHNISRVNRTSYMKVQLFFHHCERARDSHSFPSLRRHRSVYAHRVGDPCFRASVCTNMQATETKTDLFRAIRLAFHSYFVLGWTENGTNNQAIDHNGLMLHSAHNLAVVRSFHNKQTNKHTYTHAMCSGILFKI